MKSPALESCRTGHATDQPVSTGGMLGLDAIARLGTLERERIELRNRLTAWMLNPRSEESSLELLDRINAIEAEQHALRAALTGNGNDTLAA